MELRKTAVRALKKSFAIIVLCWITLNRIQQARTITFL